MTSPLAQFIQKHDLELQLLPVMQTEGFVTSMAAAPYLIDPSEWLAYLWGGTESSPFTSHEALEQYAQIIVDMWNQKRSELLSNQWQWPESCALCEREIVNEAAREFCEGLLQAWSLARDDWETIMPENSQDNALLGGVLLSVSLLFDPESAIPMLEAEGAADIAQFDEIFKAMPMMLCGLTMRGVELANLELSDDMS